MKKILIFLFVAVLVVGSTTAVLAAQTSASAKIVIPTFVIKAVEKDKLVTIQTDNLRLNDTYIVTMGAMGTRGVKGIQVATVTTTDTGRITKTFSIPAALHGSEKIAIRLESPTTGYYAYNWFYNKDVNLDLIGTAEPAPDPCCVSYKDFPTFSIVAVEKATSVTIKGNNFPPNKTFNVRMNWMGTKGIAGAIVESVTTDASGNLSDSTYLIPDFLQGSEKIAIRLESPASGYFAYNWFYNRDTP